MTDEAMSPLQRRMIEERTFPSSDNTQPESSIGQLVHLVLPFINATRLKIEKKQHYNFRFDRS
jgi:hypothetical protein